MVHAQGTHRFSFHEHVFFRIIMSLCMTSGVMVLQGDKHAPVFTLLYKAFLGCDAYEKVQVGL